MHRRPMPSAIDIDRWVEEHARIAVALPPKTSPSPSTLRSRKRKRGVLQEVSANANASPKDIPRATKMRRSARLSDDETTPRGPSTRPPLHLYDASTPVLPRAPSVTSSRSSAMSDASRKRKRTPSPQKQLALRRYARYSVRANSLAVVRTLPDPVRPLARRMQHISAGKGILVREDLSPRMRAAFGLADMDETGEGGGQGQGEADELLDPARAHLGTTPTLDSVELILAAARRHYEFAASETAWNCAVHGPLISLATQGSACRSRQDWDNITTASIHPLSLTENLTIDDESGKKVDFCLSIHPDVHDHALLRRAQVPLNQTDYFPILCNPIAISIETKAPLSSGSADDPTQLLTWASAQVARLRQLLSQCGHADPDIVPIPIFPLLLVHGHVWTFHCLEDHAARPGDDATTAMATFYEEGIVLGSTYSIAGAYQVVAALQVLMQWAEREYRPWVEAWIVEPMARQLRWLEEEKVYGSRKGA